MFWFSICFLFFLIFSNKRTEVSHFQNIILDSFNDKRPLFFRKRPFYLAFTFTKALHFQCLYVTVLSQESNVVLHVTPTDLRPTFLDKLKEIDFLFLVDFAIRQNSKSKKKACIQSWRNKPNTLLLLLCAIFVCLNYCVTKSFLKGVGKSICLGRWLFLTDLEIS